MRRFTLADLPRHLQEQIYAKDNASGKIPHPISQCDKAPTLGGSEERKDKGMERTVVRFTGYRQRPLDPDNYAGSIKDLLDGLRHSGLILGDEWHRIRLETAQEKVFRKEDERTIIEIATP